MTQTDLERFKELFDSVSVVYEQYNDRTGNIILLHYGGYPGFFTEFEFNPDGSFLNIGAGE